jgi:hypothetical protein
MVAYKFTLNLRSPPESYSFILDLTPDREDNPEYAFDSTLREIIRRKFQDDSACAVRDRHLDEIIRVWTQDIKQGYRETSLTLDLPLLIDSNVDQIVEPGNQDLPSLLPAVSIDAEPNTGLPPPLDFIFID